MLRRSGISVELGLRGNFKRRVESARKKQIGTVLILRDASANPRMHLTHYSGSQEQHEALASLILEATLGSYEGISGGPQR
jgi:hypothetical protein